MNESADFVMYWWDRAAELLMRKKFPLRRFGLVTTNSISQVFQRRVMERYLHAKQPVSLIFAVPDHPWVKIAKDSAAVRIGMTSAEAGAKYGRLSEVTAESELDTDEPKLTFHSRVGQINSDLSLGVDVTRAVALLANEGLSSPGVKLHGAGFIVTPTQAAYLGLGRRPGLERHIRPYRNGRDLTSRSRGVMIIDLFGLSAGEARQDFPEVYQHLHETVRAGRAEQFEKSPTADARSYLDTWWIFGKPRTDLRPALFDLKRYIVTVETTKHRVFQFLDASIIPDNMLVAVASSDASLLAILNSRLHLTWAPLLGGWLGYGNDPRYSKSRCFDPFPFVELFGETKLRLCNVGEELDAHRNRVLTEHPDLTLTGLYNVLEKIKAGTALTDKDEDIKQRGLVLILQELHEEIDRLTSEAYGWPVDLSDEEILARLVALNAERAKEEAAGLVRWLRPDYQIPRFGKQVAAKTGELDLPETIVAIDAALPAFPADGGEATLAIEALLLSCGNPMTSAEIARGFKRGGKRIEQRVVKALTNLVRYGRISMVDEARFVARKAA